MIADLRRRQVFKAAALYGAVGYVVVEVADVFVPALLLPDWVVTAVAFAVVLGFPLALVVAWMFDVTPEGMAREGDAPPAAAVDSPGRTGLGQWLVLAAAIFGTGLLVSVVVDMVRSRPGDEAGNDGAGAALSPARALDSSKIAVLPFVNLAAADDAAFAEGVHDDILTRLQRVRTLKVMTRQSVLEFAGSDLGADEIAVGSVRATC